MSNLESLVKEYYAAFNARDFAAYSRLLAGDCTVEAPGMSMKGIEGTQLFDQTWLKAFPDAKIETFRMTSAGDVVVAGNWFAAGRHQGTLHGPAGDIPATNALFEAPYCSRFQIRDGKIARQRLLFEFDFIPLKLGLL